MATPTPTFLTRLLRTFAPTGMAAAPQQQQAIPEGAERATVAAGCFWGVEHMYRKHFGGEGKGLIDAHVGYIGGSSASPKYKEVCSGRTGHAEAAQLIFDPTRVSYRSLFEFFYRMHDPTSINAQGPDHGTQYRSAIFFHSPEQEAVAREVTDKAASQWWGGRVATEVVPAGEWWDAEDYHQKYLITNPGGYECPSHFLRSFPDLQ